MFVATHFRRLIQNSPHHHHCQAIPSSVLADSRLNAGQEKKKVVVVGAGWAGIASSHHLIKQGLDVTLLHSGSCPSPEIGIQGFWYPYRNIFSFVDELGIQPFTKWTRIAHYSPEGMEVEFPVFKDQPRLPAPLGPFVYPRFSNLQLLDRLSSIPLVKAVIDFDNTDTAWRKYDSITSRELFRQFWSSEKLYRLAFEPVVQVGLFAPAEQCSAAATLAILSYYLLSHQQNFNVSCCRGTVEEKIFGPWLRSEKMQSLKFYGDKTVTNVLLDEDSGKISELICGAEVYKADAFVLALDINSLQSIILKSSVLRSRQEFLKVLNLSATDVVSVKLFFDKKVNVPSPANVGFGFDDDSIAWTFCDISSIYDEYIEGPATILEVTFYYANQILPQKDEEIVKRAVSYVSRCIQEFEKAMVVHQTVERHAKSASHFFPGSYKYTMRGATTFPNLFMAGDWINTRHGSWSQEKSFVTGLEAANRVVDYLGEGNFAKIIAVEEDEPHIERLRNLNRNLNDFVSQLPLSDFFLR